MDNIKDLTTTCEGKNMDAFEAAKIMRLRLKIID